MRARKDVHRRGVFVRPARAAGDNDAMEDATQVSARAVGQHHCVQDAAVQVVLGGTVLGVYLKTLYPSVAGGDSGELVAESCHLGISHPPGYPLFNMLVYLVVTYLPVNRSPAWKANAFSAVCDAVAVVVMYRTLVLWTSSRTSSAIAKTTAFTASALFAFSPLIWTYAVGAEVFSLNNLFAAVLLHTLVKYSMDRSLKLAIRGAFVCGLALCNQHTIILFELPIIVWVLWTRPRTQIQHELVVLALAFFVGLVPYVYMPIASILNPQPGSWGDVTSLSGFVHHIRRADYGTFRLFSTNQQTEGLWTRLQLYGMDLSHREAPFHLALPLATIGLLSSLSLRYLSQKQTENTLAETTNAVGRVIAGMFVFYMIVFHSLANLPLNEGLLYGVHMRFWQQPNVIVFMWIGIGMNTVIEAVVNQIQIHRRHLIATVTRVVKVSLAVYQMMRWYAFCDQSDAFYVHNYASALLDPLPLNAVLFVNFDLQWTALRYLQRCEHRRLDVTILHHSMMTYQWFRSKHSHYPNLTFPGARLVPYGSEDGFTFSHFLDSNLKLMARTKKQGGVFFGGKMTYNDRDFSDRYTFIPFGLLDEIQPLSSKPPALANWYNAQRSVQQIIKESLPDLPPEGKYDDETWEWTIARDVGMKRLSWSTYLLEQTIAQDPHNLELLSESTHAMEHSYQFEPQQFWSANANLKNLGLAYAQIVKSKKEFGSPREPFYNGNVGRSVEDRTRYKDRASARMLEVWAAWLQLPEAVHDPGYAAIYSVVEKFVPHFRKQVNRESTSKIKTSKSKAKKKSGGKNMSTKQQKKKL